MLAVKSFDIELIAAASQRSKLVCFFVSENRLSVVYYGDIGGKVLTTKLKSSSNNDHHIVDAAKEEVAAECETDVGQLFEEHNQSLLRFVTARLHSAQEAKEIAQEAYVRLLNLDQPSTVSYLRAYLFRIAANLVSDRLKQRERRSRIRSFIFFEDEKTSPSPEAELNAQDDLATIQRAISELPAKCRKAFLLHRIQGMSIDDTAHQMQLSSRMIRLYVARALEHCRSCLDKVEAENS